jgi:hypothetical protein
MTDKTAHSKSQLPRRDFLKYSSLLSASAAYAVYLTTDAKAQDPPSLAAFSGQGAQSYGYQ